MSGKPTISIDLASKHGERRIKVCAFWKSDTYAGSYSSGKTGWNVYDDKTRTSVAIDKLVLADGRVIALADYWTNLTHWEEKNGVDTSSAQPDAVPFGGADDSFGDDEIPF